MGQQLLVLIIVPLIVGKSLPYFRGDQCITHKIELSPHPYYIMKMNKNKMIQTFEKEIIIMKYQSQSYKHGYTDATRFTLILNHTQKESERKQE